MYYVVFCNSDHFWVKLYFPDGIQTVAGSASVGAVLRLRDRRFPFNLKVLETNETRSGTIIEMSKSAIAPIGEITLKVLFLLIVVLIIAFVLGKTAEPFPADPQQVPGIPIDSQQHQDRVSVNGPPVPKNITATGDPMSGYYNRLFSGNFTADMKNYKAAVHVEKVGNLGLPTGEIVASDPLMGYGAPFAQKVPPGSYPLDVAVAVIQDKNGSQNRIAAARIRFKEEMAVVWDMAITSGQKVDTLKADEFFGYGVDTGTGAFMDQETFGIFNKKMEVMSYANAIIDRLCPPDKPVQFLLHAVDETHCVAIFGSGWGDGSYPSYWGKSKSGEIVEIITDFFIVDEAGWKAAQVVDLKP